MIETATLGGGCFWCIEAALQQLDGVRSAVSGYCGGALSHPDYRTVCSGESGHIEVVQFAFENERIDYRTLLLAFFSIHDPTSRDRQGDDIGSQYRSVIFTHGDNQAKTAMALIAELDTAGHWPTPIVTEVLPAPTFWAAEDYHQDYYANNRQQPYCRVVVAPKLDKVRNAFAERLKGKGAPPQTGLSIST
ncbi:MAG: peptide-methionine (S)-S-oxide reductase MsrA [Rhodocyclaceae bacterium]|jgi:peptide-methionine (S)-S-oxide reductase|nr:peptide-methionine (S)-S-oxide reductase MsrA [Rhodocyclaceae bacterium]